MHLYLPNVCRAKGQSALEHSVKKRPQRVMQRPIDVIMKHCIRWKEKRKMIVDTVTQILPILPRHFDMSSFQRQSHLVSARIETTWMVDSWRVAHSRDASGRQASGCTETNTTYGEEAWRWTNCSCASDDQMVMCGQFTASITPVAHQTERRQFEATRSHRQCLNSLLDAVVVNDHKVRLQTRADIHLMGWLYIWQVLLALCVYVNVVNNGDSQQYRRWINNIGINLRGLMHICMSASQVKPFGCRYHPDSGSSSLQSICTSLQLAFLLRVRRIPWTRSFTRLSARQYWNHQCRSSIDDQPNPAERRYAK